MDTHVTALTRRTMVHSAPEVKTDGILSISIKNLTVTDNWIF